MKENVLSQHTSSFDPQLYVSVEQEASQKLHYLVHHSSKYGEQQVAAGKILCNLDLFVKPLRF